MSQCQGISHDGWAIRDTPLLGEPIQWSCRAGAKKGLVPTAAKVSVTAGSKSGQREGLKKLGQAPQAGLGRVLQRVGSTYMRGWTR
jgi:hypothetical protein